MSEPGLFYDEDLIQGTAPWTGLSSETLFYFPEVTVLDALATPPSCPILPDFFEKIATVSQHLDGCCVSNATSLLNGCILRRSSISFAITCSKSAVISSGKHVPPRLSNPFTNAGFSEVFREVGEVWWPTLRGPCKSCSRAGK